jgi:hypothetical protein
MAHHGAPGTGAREGVAVLLTLDRRQQRGNEHVDALVLLRGAPHQCGGQRADKAGQLALDAGQHCLRPGVGRRPGSGLRGCGNARGVGPGVVHTAHDAKPSRARYPPKVGSRARRYAQCLLFKG